MKNNDLEILITIITVLIIVIAILANVSEYIGIVLIALLKIGG